MQHIKIAQNKTATLFNIYTHKIATLLTFEIFKSATHTFKCTTLFTSELPVDVALIYGSLVKCIAVLTAPIVKSVALLLKNVAR